MMQRTKDLDTAELLEQLPALQELLYRVLGCQVIHDFIFGQTSLSPGDQVFTTENNMLYGSIFKQKNFQDFFLFIVEQFFILLQPQGAAVHNFVIQMALSLVGTSYDLAGPLKKLYSVAWMILLILISSIFLQVASESIKIYQAISDGTVNLVDKVRIVLII